MTDREFHRALKALMDQVDVKNLKDQRLMNMIESMLKALMKLAKELHKRTEPVESGD